MANSGALIKESIWRSDRDFRQLPRLAQCTYQQLLAQKELDCAGLLTLNLPVLAKGCDEITEDQLRADLQILEERRFVFVDYDTYELFVRGRMRALQVVRSPNLFKSAMKSARMVESPKLRTEVAAELRRLRRTEATQIADELDPSETPPEGPPNGSGTLPDWVTPSETLPEPSISVQVSDKVSPSLGGYVGEGPSPFCADHPNDTDRKCFACGQARRTYPDRKAAWDNQRRLAAAHSRQAAIKACTRCDEFGEITYDDAVRRCDHQAAAHA